MQKVPSSCEGLQDICRCTVCRIFQLHIAVVAACARVSCFARFANGIYRTGCCVCEVPYKTKQEPCQTFHTSFQRCASVLW